MEPMGLKGTQNTDISEIVIYVINLIYTWIKMFKLFSCQFNGQLTSFYVNVNKNHELEHSLNDTVSRLYKLGLV